MGKESEGERGCLQNYSNFHNRTHSSGFACIVDPTYEMFHNTNPGGRLVISETYVDGYSGDSHGIVLDISSKKYLKEK